MLCHLNLNPNSLGNILVWMPKPSKHDYPNLKELGRNQHSNYVKYLTLNGRILMARYDEKKGAWQITMRQPSPNEVEYYMSKGEWEFD